MNKRTLSVSLPAVRDHAGKNVCDSLSLGVAENIGKRPVKGSPRRPDSAREIAESAHIKINVGKIVADDKSDKTAHYNKCRFRITGKFYAWWGDGREI